MNSPRRLAHGWQLSAAPDIPQALVREFIRPVARAVPRKMARQLGACRVSLVAGFGRSDTASQWTASSSGVEISIASRDRSGHEIAMELLLCLGEALWETLAPGQVKAYWQLLDAEVQAGVDGEIDDEALAGKTTLLRDRSSARSARRLQQYGRASFSATAAEYVHCLWHDVEVVSGREHLPALPLQRRLELLSRWFPPNPGYRLYPAKPARLPAPGRS